MGASYYLKLGSLAVLTGELRILRTELDGIFSTIYVDKEGTVRIKNEQALQSDQEFDVNTHKNQLGRLDTSLNDWIVRHGQVFK